MIPYISSITHTSALKYQLEIYMKGSHEQERVDELLIIHNNSILCKVYVDGDRTGINVFDDRINLKELNFNITSNKRVRSMCRIIGLSIGVDTNE